MGRTASQSGDVCAVQCLTEGPNSDKLALEMGARLWARDVCSLKPGHCVDSSISMIHRCYSEALHT